jgi:hypothetical protein
MTDILSTNDCLFTKNDMIMTDNGYYASMPMLQSSAADTSAADTSAADTSAADTSAADTIGGNKNNAGDKVSDNYKNLAIPALYLYTINGTCAHDADANAHANDEIMDNELIDDDLYNKLILLAEMKQVINKKYTRHKKNIKKIKARKTRRNK